jgi:hypothetical protein
MNQITQTAVKNIVECLQSVIDIHQVLSTFDIVPTNIGSTLGKLPKRERISVRVERLSFIPPPKGDIGGLEMHQNGVMDISIMIHALPTPTQPEPRIEQVFDVIAGELMGFDPIKQLPETYLHITQAMYEPSDTDYILYKIGFQCAVVINTRRKLRNK